MGNQEKDRSNQDGRDRKKKKKKHRESGEPKDPGEKEHKKEKPKERSEEEHKKHRPKERSEEEHKKHKHEDRSEGEHKHKHKDLKKSKENSEESKKKDKKNKHKKASKGKEKHCPACKHKVPSGATQCPECGEAIKHKKKANPLLIPLIGFAVMIVICGLAFWYFINKSNQKALLIHQKQLRVTIVNTLKSIYEAEATFAKSGRKNKGDYGTFQELAADFADFPPDEKDENKGTFKGYVFRIKVTIGKAPRRGEKGEWVERAFSVTAMPASDAVGPYGFYMDQKGKITYTDDGSTPTAKSKEWKGELEP